MTLKRLIDADKISAICRVPSVPSTVDIGHTPTFSIHYFLIAWYYEALTKRPVYLASIEYPDKSVWCTSQVH